MTSLTLASETPSLAASLATNASRSASCSLTSLAADLLQRGAQLGLRDAELLGERGDRPGAPGAGAAAAQAAAGCQPPGAGRASAARSLASLTPILLREVAEGGLVGAAIRPGLQRVEGGADLGRVDAELGREGVVEALEPVAAPLAAHDLAVPWNFSSAAVTLASSRPSSVASALASSALRSSLRAAVGTQVLERRAQLGLGHAELGGDAGEVAGAAGPGPGRAGRGEEVGVAAGERGPVARLAPERVGPGGEHERAAERGRRLLGTWGHGESIGEATESS